MNHNGTRHPLFITALIITSVGFVALLLGFWQPIFWAAVIGIMFRPLHLRLKDRLDGRETLAAILTCVLIFFTVLVPALLVASAVAAEAAGIYQRIQSGEWDVGEAVRWLQGLLPQASALAERVGIDLNGLPDKLSTAAVRSSKFVATLALSAGQNVAVFFVFFFLMLYVLFFILRDGERILMHIHHGIPLPDELERRLFRKFAEVSRATIKGTMVVGFIQGTLGGIIFAVLGIEGALFWGVVMVVLSVLPAVGAGIIWLPAAIILAVSGTWIKSLILVAFGVLVIGLVDNLLRPVLVGRDTKMPDYLILLSTLGGLATVGITGFVLGPVVASLFLAGWQMFEEESPAPANPGGS